MSKVMALNEIHTQFQHLDALIRQGQQGEARKLLLEHNLKVIPREALGDFADLARRLNMPRLMLSVLKSLVYQEKPGLKKASTRESALYATALSRLGAFEEAQNRLKKLNGKEDPEVLLFSAQNSMLQWDYSHAIPKLKKYLKEQSLSPYQKIIGKVNLAACFTGEMRWQDSDRILEEIWNEIQNLSTSEERQSYELLYANSLGIAANSLFLRGKIQNAKELIRTADQILLGTNSRYELLVKKWKLIIETFENPDNPDARDRFRKMTEEARKTRDWETLRDFEFYEALAFRNDELFIKLYHGSPYSSYRKRIKKIYKPTFVIPRMIDWKIGPSTSSMSPTRVFDLSKGCEIGGTARLISFPLLFKVLKCLTKDFYRSVALGSLFSSLYPNEYFNPHSSPNRVYVAVKRLRKWFEDQKIPLNIEVQDDRFKLVASDEYCLRVSFQNINVSKNDAWLESLSRHFEQKNFTQEQAAKALQIPGSSVRRFLLWACRNGDIRRLKLGKSIQYKWVK